MPLTNCITNTPRTHKVGISAAAAFGANPAITRQLLIESMNHQWTPEYAEDEGNNGTPWRASEGVRLAAERGSGAITLVPRADDLRFILPLLVGGTFAGSPPNELEPEFLCDFFSLQVDQKLIVSNFRGAKTANWSLTSSRSQPLLTLEWGIESSTHQRGAAGSFTGGLNFSTLPPFVHTSSTITIDGRVYAVDDVSIAGNNNLDLELFYNSVTRTDLPPGDQIITFTHTSPFDVAADGGLLDLGATSVAAQVLYTAAGGDLSLTIDFPALHAPVSTPVTPQGNTPVRYNGLQWTARSKGTGGTYEKPVKFTLDDTL